MGVCISYDIFYFRSSFYGCYYYFSALLTSIFLAKKMYELTVCKFVLCFCALQKYPRDVMYKKLQLFGRCQIKSDFPSSSGLCDFTVVVFGNRIELQECKVLNFVMKLMTGLECLSKITFIL